MDEDSQQIIFKPTTVAAGGKVRLSVQGPPFSTRPTHLVLRGSVAERFDIHGIDVGGRTCVQTDFGFPGVMFGEEADPIPLDLGTLPASGFVTLFVHNKSGEEATFEGRLLVRPATMDESARARNEAAEPEVASTSIIRRCIDWFVQGLRAAEEAGRAVREGVRVGQGSWEGPLEIRDQRERESTLPFEITIRGGEVKSCEIRPRWPISARRLMIYCDGATKDCEVTSLRQGQESLLGSDAPIPSWFLTQPGLPVGAPGLAPSVEPIVIDIRNRSESEVTIRGALTCEI